MTEINFGNTYDKSKAKLDIQAAGDSKTKIATGEQHNESTLEATVRDSASAANTLSSDSVFRDPQTNQENNQHATQRLNTILAFSFGLILIATVLILVIAIPNPTPLQSKVFSAVLALAAGGFASVIPGLLNVRLDLSKKVLIGASGALAVFVIIYFFVPAMSN